MKRFTTCVRAAAVAVAVLLAAPAWAGGSVRVGDAWARATPPGVSVGAAYLVVDNGGDKPETLLGASTPVASEATLHATVVQGTTVKMVPLGTPVIEPGGSLRLAPSGAHVMLMGLHRPLKPGDHFPLTLRFEKAGPITVDVTVRAAGATSEAAPAGKAHAAAAAKGPKVFDFTIAKGRRVSGPATMRVHQGDDVALRFSVDQPLELHLHGYDIELQVKPGTLGMMGFHAGATGRFPIEIHGAAGHGHGAVTYLEVYPK